MNCKLIAVTQPRLPECETAEELVAYCARVSNPANQANKATAQKLIGYLVNNKHWSPLEMVHVVIEIDSTRDIIRQILRHGSFKFQEFSQRYAEALDFVEPREGRFQDKKNRQNSIDTDPNSDVELWWRAAQAQHIKTSEKLYRAALHENIAKEQARVVLPEGLTASRIYMAGSLRSWIHYCQLRMANGTQKEHMQIAKECWKIICAEFPGIADLFKPDELEEAVKAFSEELLNKLKYKRDVDGYEGWDDPEWTEEEKWRDLQDHTEKRDPIDTAAYSLFIHHARKR